MKNFQNRKSNFTILSKVIGIACILTTSSFAPLNVSAQEPELYCINHWVNPNTGEGECFDSNMTLITTPKPKSSESDADNDGVNYKFEHFRSGSCINKATNETEAEMAKTVVKMHQNVDDSMNKIDRLDEILAIEKLNKLTMAEKKEYIVIEDEINVLIEEYNRMSHSLDEASVKIKSSTSSPYFKKCFNENYDKLDENTDAVSTAFKTKPSGVRLYVPPRKRTRPEEGRFQSR